MNFFENYAIVAMESDNVTFYACKIIKVTSGFNLKKRIFFARWRQHPQNSRNIFQIQITSLLWHPQDPHGCLEKQNYPLSLNLVVWCAKIQPKIKKVWKTSEMTRKTSKNDFFGSILKFLGFGPNCSTPNYQIQIQWMISFL